MALLHSFWPTIIFINNPALSWCDITTEQPVQNATDWESLWESHTLSEISELANKTEILQLGVGEACMHWMCREWMSQMRWDLSCVSPDPPGAIHIIKQRLNWEQGSMKRQWTWKVPWWLKKKKKKEQKGFCNTWIQQGTSAYNLSH